MDSGEKTSSELNGERFDDSPLGQKKMNGFEYIGSVFPVAQSYGQKITRNRLLMSIYVVIFKARINLLLPFGPLAVILHYLRGKHGASQALSMPVAFISVILLPIVGNAAEQASAIMFAMKDKLIPFCVVIGWIMGKEMDLNFQLFETASLFITVLVVAFMLQEGTANYFKGLMLILCYLIVAASFFEHVDPSSNDNRN